MYAKTLRELDRSDIKAMIEDVSRMADWLDVMNKKRLTDDQGLKMELAGVMCRLSSSASILEGNLVVSIEV
ncbi:MAG: hypothetical protein BWX81_00555 [Spirochaetes bacterium ADurb.Bin110]|jgi:hypothetical protein|nr:MAG: hypothetical protein BWX81_00555 [Spirochaetes bacterium ADurb.Bin110]